MKSCGGGRGIAPLILNLFATWTIVVIIRARWLDNRLRTPGYAMNTRLGGPPEPLDIEGDRNTAGPYASRTPHRPVCSHSLYRLIYPGSLKMFKTQGNLLL